MRRTVTVYSTRACWRAVLALALGALLGAAPLAQAQLYKWTGADGRVHYTDTPPPASARKVETRPQGVSGTEGGAGLPYELAEAARKQPVVLYTTSNCAPCELGRALLARRGVPYAEKTVVSNEDIARLRAAGGAQQLPLLTIGRAHQSGFEPDAWNSALSAAGYPESSQLPRNFRQAQAEPAAGPAPAAPDLPAAAPKTPPATPTVPPPPGFRF